MPSWASGSWLVEAMTSTAWAYAFCWSRSICVYSACLPMALLRRGTAGGALEEVADRLVELGGGHDLVDQAPVERRARVDDVTGQGQLHGALRPTFLATATMGVWQNQPPLPPGAAKPASSLATARSALATSWQPAAVASPCTRANHRLRHLLHQRHQLGAGKQQRADRRQVSARYVGEVMPGAEHRAVGRPGRCQARGCRRGHGRPRSAPACAPVTGHCGAAAGSS